MRNLWRICRLNHASLTCCYNRGRCRPSNPIQNPNYLEPRLIDVKKISCGGSRNHQRRMLANWIDEKSPLENMQQQDKQIAPTQTHDADSNKPVLTENMQLDKQIASTETDVVDSYKPVLTENMQQEDKQIAAATEVESSSKINKKFYIVCSDRIRIDSEPFKRESLAVQASYKYGFNFVQELKVNSEIMKKVELFCVERGKIQNDYAHDQTLLQHKLNDLNSNFRQQNRIHALNLMTAAFELEIRSLVDLMMDDVIDFFGKMTSEDEAYEILCMNLRDEYSHTELKRMNTRVMFNKWAFE